MSWSELYTLMERVEGTYRSLDIRLLASRRGSLLELVTGRVLPLPTRRAGRRKKVRLGDSLVLIREVTGPDILEGLMESASSGQVSVAGARVNLRPTEATVSERPPWLQAVVWAFPFPLVVGELANSTRPPNEIGPVVLDGRAYEDLDALVRQEVIIPEGVAAWRPGRGYLRFLLPIYAGITDVKLSGRDAIVMVIHHEDLSGRISLLPAVRGESPGDYGGAGLKEVAKAGSLVRSRARLRLSGSVGGSAVLTLDGAPVDEVPLVPRRILAGARMAVYSHFDRGLRRLRTWLRQADRMDGRNFEFAVFSLLYVLGFDPVWLGYMPSASPDVVAVSGDRAILVECTVAPPKPEKVAILGSRAEDLAYATGLKVVPVLFFVGRRSELDSEVIEEAEASGVLLADSPVVETLLKVASTGGGVERALEVLRLGLGSYPTHRASKREIAWEWLRDDVMPEVRILLRGPSRRQA
ncbi:MAG: hypothetical protein QI223_02550 [Candidatus Korarchaeota archaeon]|nr:hypothetical protein [Candidatus Korarchaeota archaeon]